MHKQPKKIGLTGGIGSGKTHVSKVFASLGYAVYNADDRAKYLMVTNKKLISEISQLFGARAYFADGNLNRKAIGEIVFKNPEKLAALNGLVHPAVGIDFQKWYSDLLPDYEREFILRESAILFEAGLNLRSDGIISVYAPKVVRIQRVVARDQLTESAILDRMARQWSSQDKNRLSDFVIFNDGRHHISPQIARAINYFKEIPHLDNQ